MMNATDKNALKPSFRSDAVFEVNSVTHTADGDGYTKELIENNTIDGLDNAEEGLNGNEEVSPDNAVGKQNEDTCRQSNEINRQQIGDIQTDEMIHQQMHAMNATQAGGMVEQLRGDISGQPSHGESGEIDKQHDVVNGTPGDGIQQKQTENSLGQHSGWVNGKETEEMDIQHNAAEGKRDGEMNAIQTVEIYGLHSVDGKPKDVINEKQTSEEKCGQENAGTGTQQICNDKNASIDANPENKVSIFIID